MFRALGTQLLPSEHPLEVAGAEVRSHPGLFG